MNKYCPLCQAELQYLDVVKERAIEWNGDTWVVDPKPTIVIQCPECGDELDVTDLGMLGITPEQVQELTETNLANELILARAEVAGIGSVLLDVQRDCIAARKTVLDALNIIYWKVPSVAGDKSGQWWAAELRDKDIPIDWDNEKAEFVPGVK